MYTLITTTKNIAPHIMTESNSNMMPKSINVGLVSYAMFLFMQLCKFVITKNHKAHVHITLSVLSASQLDAHRLHVVYMCSC